VSFYPVGEEFPAALCAFHQFGQMVVPYPVEGTHEVHVSRRYKRKFAQLIIRGHTLITFAIFFILVFAELTTTSAICHEEKNIKKSQLGYDREIRVGHR
jgi:hypothetical protein